MYGTWSWHIYSYAFGFVLKTGCDRLLLETSSKTKDILKSRQDLVAMEIREDLHPIEKGNGRYELPSAAYNLRHDEKKAMCERLRGIRVPSRFSSNIKKLVSMKDLSLCGYNCHDCHVLLTLFLPIVTKAIKPVYMKMVITRLCYFFNKIKRWSTKMNWMIFKNLLGRLWHNSRCVSLLVFLI